MPKVPKSSVGFTGSYSNPTGLSSNAAPSGLSNLSEGLRIFAANRDKLRKAKDTAQSRLDINEFKVEHQSFLIDKAKEIEKGRLTGQFKDEVNTDKFLKDSSDAWVKERLAGVDASRHQAMGVAATGNMNFTKVKVAHVEEARTTEKFHRSLSEAKSSLIKGVLSDPSTYEKQITDYAGVVGLALKDAGVQGQFIKEKLNKDIKQGITSAAMALAAEGRFAEGKKLLTDNFQYRFDQFEEIPKLLKEMADLKKQSDADAYAQEVRNEGRLKRKVDKDVDDFEYNIKTQIGNIDLQSLDAQGALAEIRKTVYDKANQINMTQASRTRIEAAFQGRFGQLSQWNEGPLSNAIASGESALELKRKFKEQAKLGLTAKAQAHWLKVIGSYSSLKNIDPKVLQAHIAVIKAGFDQKTSLFRSQWGSNDSLHSSAEASAILKFVEIAGAGIAANPTEARTLAMGYYLDSHKSLPLIIGIPAAAQADKDSIGKQLRKMKHLYKNDRRSLKLNNGQMIPEKMFFEIIQGLQDRLLLINNSEYMKGVKADKERFQILDKIMKGSFDDPDKKAEVDMPVYPPLGRQVQARRHKMETLGNTNKDSTINTRLQESTDLAKRLQDAIDKANKQKKGGK